MSTMQEDLKRIEELSAKNTRGIKGISEIVKRLCRSLKDSTDLLVTLADEEKDLGVRASILVQVDKNISVFDNLPERGLYASETKS